MIISLDDACTHHFSPTTPHSHHISPACFGFLLGPPAPWTVEFKMMAIEIPKENERIVFEGEKREIITSWSLIIQVLTAKREDLIHTSYLLIDNNQ